MCLGQSEPPIHAPCPTAGPGHSRTQALRQPELGGASLIQLDQEKLEKEARAPGRAQNHVSMAANGTLVARTGSGHRAGLQWPKSTM